MRADYKMIVQFGWVGAKCGDGSISSANPDVYDECPSHAPSRIISQTCYFMPLNIVATYEGGKIKFTIEGVDLLRRTMGMRIDKPVGAEGKFKEMSTREAIQKMLKDEAKTEVAFKYKNAAGNCADMGFEQDDGVSETDSFPPKGSYGGPKGPKRPANLTPLGAAMEWLKPLKTHPNKKAVVPLWDVNSPTPRLVFTEDPMPKCDCDGFDPARSSLGTYIVNGGKNSPVLQFQPKVNWPFEGSTPQGGTNASGASATTETIKENPQFTCQDLVNFSNNAGSGGNPVAAEAQAEASEKKANAGAAESVQRMTRAYKPYEAITCQLTVQGDPSFASPTFLVGRTFSIIVINPYHYSRQVGDGCGEWLARPIINETYSNRSWFIQGCTHQIKEGSYQTMFDLMLPAPGVDINPKLPVGCPESGGKVLDL